MITKQANLFIEKRAIIGPLVNLGLGAASLAGSTKSHLKAFANASKYAPHRFVAGLGAGSYLGNVAYNNKPGRRKIKKLVNQQYPYGTNLDPKHLDANIQKIPQVN